MTSCTRCEWRAWEAALNTRELSHEQAWNWCLLSRFVNNDMLVQPKVEMPKHVKDNDKIKCNTLNARQWKVKRASHKNTLCERLKGGVGVKSSRCQFEKHDARLLKSGKRWTYQRVQLIFEHLFSLTIHVQALKFSGWSRIHWTVSGYIFRWTLSGNWISNRLWYPLFPTIWQPKSSQNGNRSSAKWAIFLSYEVFQTAMNEIVMLHQGRIQILSIIV